MAEKLKIAGICGSLRKASLNRMALKVAQANMPEGAELEIVEIGDLPHFNQDLEANIPESVVKFREQIAKADAILFAVTEYNYSVSSVLKNAIEWASRPMGYAVLNRKPVALMGASNGMLGTGRAQYHLRQILLQVDAQVLTRPEVLITFAQEKFTESGELTDEHTLEKIRELVKALVEWTVKTGKN